MEGTTESAIAQAVRGTTGQLRKAVGESNCDLELHFKFQP